MRVAGRHFARNVHRQLIGAERRLHVEPGRVVTEPERVGIELPRRQRRREQHGGAGRGIAWLEKRRRHHIAQAQGGVGHSPAAAPGTLERHVEDRMRAEGFQQPAELQCIEIELQQRAVEADRPGLEDGGDRRRGILQRRDETGRRLRLHLVRLGLPGDELAPAALQPVERLFQFVGSHRACLAQAQRAQFGAVHGARALEQVVGFVDQHRDAPIIGHGQRMQQRAAVEVVVVVTHHQVAPASHFLAEVVRADLVRQRHVAQRGLRQRAGVGARHGRAARCRQPVVEAARQRARIAVADLVGVLARLVARCQVEHSQAQRRSTAAQRLHRLQRQAAPRALGRQVVDLVDLLAGAGFQEAEHGGHRLADAGRRLRHQAAAQARRVVDAFRQLALAGAKAIERELQRGQGIVTCGTVRQLLVGPRNEAFAQRLEVRLEFRRAAVLQQRLGLLLLPDVEVDQRHRHRRQPVQPAQQVPVDLGLRPMQGTVVGRHALQIALEGLDFLDLCVRKIETIGPSAHAQMPILAADGDLGLIARAAPRRHALVAGNALLRGGRGREAQVQVALPGRVIAQRAHGDGVVRWTLRRPEWQVHLFSLTGAFGWRRWCVQRWPISSPDGQRCNGGAGLGSSAGSAACRPRPCPCCIAKMRPSMAFRSGVKQQNPVPSDPESRSSACRLLPFPVAQRSGQCSGCSTPASHGEAIDDPVLALVDGHVRHQQVVALHGMDQPYFWSVNSRNSDAARWLPRQRRGVLPTAS